MRVLKYITFTHALEKTNFLTYSLARLAYKLLEIWFHFYFFQFFSTFQFDP